MEINYKLIERLVEVYKDSDHTILENGLIYLRKNCVYDKLYFCRKFKLIKYFGSNNYQLLYDNDKFDDPFEVSKNIFYSNNIFNRLLGRVGKYRKTITTYIDYADLQNHLMELEKELKKIK